MLVEDFIGIEENAFPQSYCQQIIENFDNIESQGFSYSRQQSENKISPLRKKDTAINTVITCSTTFPSNYLSDGLGTDFLNVFWQKYDSYVSLIPGMATIKDNVYIRNSKCQKTLIGEGYHVWHADDSSDTIRNRLLAYVLYLNDVEEGGETEFLHQHRRVKPTQGTLVIFPSGFTHTHRGNPPLSGSKYIITGWVEF